MTSKEWLELKSKTNTKKTVSKLYSSFVKDTGSIANEETYKRKVRDFYLKNKPMSMESVIDSNVSIEENQSSDTYNAFITSTWIKTPEQLIDYLKIDIKKWELIKFTRNIWGSDENPNVQVKGEFKVRTNIPSTKEMLDIIKASIEDFKPVFFKQKNLEKQTDNMLEIAIQDQHFGQLSLSSESGSDYNLTIAHDNYINAVRYFLTYSVSFNLSKIVFVIGSDFFNVDNPANTTFAGTPQNESSLWKDTFRKGLETCIEAIEICYDFVPNIDIKIVQGNHDFTRAFYLGMAIKQRYINNKNINVDISDEPRKYTTWGKNLICFTHGDKETVQRLPIIISKEMPKEFAKSKYIEAHCGHLHAEKSSLVFASEDAVIKYRVLPSLVPESSWSKQKGLFHLQESKAFIWNKEKGNIINFNYHI